MTTFADSIDISAPAGTDDPSEADDNMRRIQAGYQQRLDVDHVFALSGTTVDAADTGEHRKVTFNVAITDPTQVASKAHLYMKDDELRYQDDTNSAFDLTSAGKLGSASTDLLANDFDPSGDIDPTSYATDNGGFLDEDDMASDAADKVASQQSIKKYIDDNTGSANYTPTSYAGEESVIFPNGLIFKQGKRSIGANTATAISFGAAFPTALVSVSVSLDTVSKQTSTGGPHGFYAESVNGLTLNNGEDGTRILHWQVWGY